MAASKQGTGMLTLDFHHQGHGSFRVTTAAIDWAIDHYLPAPIEALRNYVSEVTGFDYSDIQTMTDCLAILADMHAPDYLRP